MGPEFDCRRCDDGSLGEHVEATSLVEAKTRVEGLSDSNGESVVRRKNWALRGWGDARSKQTSKMGQV